MQRGLMLRLHNTTRMHKGAPLMAGHSGRRFISGTVDVCSAAHGQQRNLEGCGFMDDRIVRQAPTGGAVDVHRAAFGLLRDQRDCLRQAQPQVEGVKVADAQPAVLHPALRSARLQGHKPFKASCLPLT